MKTFAGKLAVITGGGTGMGRELARALVREGCAVALCDVIAETMEETLALCVDNNPREVTVSSHLCDVSNEAEVLAFRDAVLEAHATDAVQLLFNNAGIGGAGSFVLDDRQDWDKTFGVCWQGVYFCSRAFLPALMASDEAHLVNTSSVNGFWASLGHNTAHTAYSAAKFAVRGFSEALINDFRLNAPHVKVSVVMPGHIGTEIATNSGRILGKAEPMEMPADEVESARRRMSQLGLPVEGLSDDEIRAAVAERNREFREEAPMTAEEAVAVILEGVRAERWRILVGTDAEFLDQAVRAVPEEAYGEEFMERLAQVGHLQAVTASADDRTP